MNPRARRDAHAALLCLVFSLMPMAGERPDWRSALARRSWYLNVATLAICLGGVAYGYFPRNFPPRESLRPIGGIVTFVREGSPKPAPARSSSALSVVISHNGLDEQFRSSSRWAADRLGTLQVGDAVVGLRHESELLELRRASNSPYSYDEYRAARSAELHRLGDFMAILCLASIAMLIYASRRERRSAIRTTTT